jgi:hypothetical protein
MHALPMDGLGGQQEWFEVSDLQSSAGNLLTSGKEVTYPRFVALTRPRGGLALEYRTGVSGLGDCWLFVYRGDGLGTWIKRGKYLQGVENNP